MGFLWIEYSIQIRKMRFNFVIISRKNKTVPHFFTERFLCFFNDYFVFSMLASALATTFSAVKPKWGKSLPAGADAPNVVMQTVSP